MAEEFIIDSKNYATDPDLAGKAIKFMSDVGQEVQTRRQTLDRRYMEYYNIFRTIFDVRYYEGTNQVYIPQLRKNIESVLARLKKALFPTDDILSASPVDPDMADNSDVITTHLRWQIEKRVKMKKKIDRLLRQYLMYGWTVVKCVWEREVKKIYGMEIQKTEKTETVIDPLTEAEYEKPTGEVEEELIEVEKNIVIKDNPSFDPVDIFSFYIYPYSANDLEEALGVFELTKQAIWDIRSRGETDEYANTDKLTVNMHDKTDLWNWSKEERLSNDGLSENDEVKGVHYFTLINYWGKFNWGDDTNPDWQDTVITTAQNIVLQLRKNPHYDQGIPYLQGRLTELQNEAYPTGMIEPQASLQYYINDTLAQTFDSIQYSLNPIVKYDPGQIVNVDSIAFAPGAMWATTDPTGVILDRPPDVSAIGFNAAAQVKSIIEEYPGLQNIPLTGRKAATHISAIQQEYSLPIINMAEALEEQIFSPWLRMAHFRNQQFLTKKEIFLVTGKQGIKHWQKMSPEMLVADYNFYWKGSNQTTNIHVKAKQIAEFLNVATPFIPILAQEGKKLNIGFLLKDYWSKALAMDGAEQIIEDVKEDRSIDPEAENILLSAGKYIPVSRQDDDKQHLQVHEQIESNPQSQALKERHVQEHTMQMQEKQMAMQQLQNRRPGGAEGQGEVQGERTLEGMQP